MGMHMSQCVWRSGDNKPPSPSLSLSHLLSPSLSLSLLPSPSPLPFPLIYLTLTPSIAAIFYALFSFPSAL